MSMSGIPERKGRKRKLEPLLLLESVAEDTQEPSAEHAPMPVGLNLRGATNLSQGLPKATGKHTYLHYNSLTVAKL